VSARTITAIALLLVLGACGGSAGAQANAASAVSADAAAEQLFQRAKALREAKQERQAVPLLREAAQRGHPRAQHLMGWYHQTGRAGVEKDERLAASWFANAAAQGNRASQYSLGTMYEEGEGGLPKDRVMAARLYRQSADQRFGLAMFSLGLAYEFGWGVPRDRRQATMWLDRSAAQGDGRAGWISGWLKDRSTPQFANEVQLGRYIAARISQRIPQFGGGGVATSGGSSSGGAATGGGCGYSSYGACNAAKAGDLWAADRIERGTSSGSEKAWYGR
jgi:TPR repeat protein